jgi:hypothetical protein
MNPRAVLSMIIAGVVFLAVASPAFAWWQFVANAPSGQRQVSPHYDTEAECQKVLKATESELAKRYPDLYPLVGSCEEYR